jgi:hypothetical protein
MTRTAGFSPSMITRFFTLLLATGLSWSATGCVVGGDSGEPVLAVDLYWDESDRADRFVGGTCTSADVAWMEWELLDSQGDRVVAGEDGGEACQDGFNFNQLELGTYKLVVSGFDDQDVELWRATCKGLRLERFDVLYSCDVDR